MGRLSVVATDTDISEGYVPANVSGTGHSDFLPLLVALTDSISLVAYAGIPVAGRPSLRVRALDVGSASITPGPAVTTNPTGQDALAKFVRLSATHALLVYLDAATAALEYAVVVTCSNPAVAPTVGTPVQVDYGAAGVSSASTGSVLVAVSSTRAVLVAHDWTAVIDTSGGTVTSVTFTTFAANTFWPLLSGVPLSGSRLVVMGTHLSGGVWHKVFTVIDASSTTTTVESAVDVSGGSSTNESFFLNYTGWLVASPDADEHVFQWMQNDPPGFVVSAAEVAVPTGSAATITLLPLGILEAVNEICYQPASPSDQATAIVCPAFIYNGGLGGVVAYLFDWPGAGSTVLTPAESLGLPLIEGQNFGGTIDSITRSVGLLGRILVIAADPTGHTVAACLIQVGLAEGWTVGYLPLG